MPAQTRDRLRGVLLGLAAGDRNGGPVRMAVRLAESLAQRGRFDREDVLARYLGWWREGAFDTGPVTAEVLALMDAGVPHAAAVERVDAAAGGMTAGCNPAHRCAPLAMAAFLADSELAACAVAEASLTHRAPLAGDVAAAVATLCRALVREIPWVDALALARQGRCAPTAEALAAHTRAHLSRGGFAPEALGAAVHFVGASSSFEEALTAALAFAGPANYCPVLVGAIAAARWGSSAIPARLLDHCDMLPRVVAAADALGRGW